MTPAALGKAEQLYNYAQRTGYPLNTFALLLTLGEAYELLDYLAEQHKGCVNTELLQADILEAKTEGNPWKVLANFQLKGLDIVRADQVLN